MARPTTREITPDNVTEVVKELIQLLSGEVEFGHPQDPLDPNSATYADGSSHNGTPSNINVSWFEADIETVDTRIDCVHNLEAPVVVVGGNNQPNVRWPIANFVHDGTGASVISGAIGVVYESTDQGSITSNSFPLRLYAPGRTVDATHPVKMTLGFIRAVR